MASEIQPIIVLCGLETPLYNLLESFLSQKYLLFPVDFIASLDFLQNHQVLLFIINSDKRSFSHDVIQKIKENENFMNTPFIGLSLKRHFSEMSHEERYEFQDILLLPARTEDILTRIDIWVKTSEIIMDDSTPSKTFALDDLQVEDLHIVDDLQVQ
jgi:hypothetical protein